MVVLSLALFLPPGSYQLHQWHFCPEKVGGVCVKLPVAVDVGASILYTQYLIYMGCFISLDDMHCTVPI